jgi:hypothetical protein
LNREVAGLTKREEIPPAVIVLLSRQMMDGQDAKLPVLRVRASLVARHPRREPIPLGMAAPDTAVVRLGSDAVMQSLSIRNVLAAKSATHRIPPQLISST